MKKNSIKIFLVLFILLKTGFSQDSWSFLNTQRIGAEQFIKDNPQANGKNVVIFIMDSGVDVATPGLTILPDSTVKVIDVQDFSGEGDIYLDLAEKGSENDEEYLQAPDGFKLFGYNHLSEQAIDSIYYIGSIDESKFINNHVNDLNANGKRDDRFGIIVFQNKKDHWIAYVDLDADGNLTDEHPVTDYSEYQKPLKFRGYDKKYDYPPLNCALKIYPDEQKVSFHFDADGHGTHVAGIAAGYRINGEQTLNGIAPGAKIISLKIGDNRYSGASTTTGAMRKAIDYIAQYVSTHKKTVVANMSYGIGSEMEGQSDIESYLNDVLSENENIVFCISAGNEGPGLSTVGLPAASFNAITVGALNTPDNARDIYGGNINKDKIFSFSARGGEVAKPDVVAPGAASSTVPPFSASEIKRGTSMAAPQTTGAVALLLSAITQDFTDKKVTAFDIKKAIMNSAVPLRDYSLPDQGNGVINVPEAYDYLKDYVKENSIITGYNVSTISPFYKSGYGSAVFWRYGTYFPTTNDRQKVYINPVFNINVIEGQKNKFYKAFSLSASTDWLRVNQNNVYIKGTEPAELEIYFDKKRLNKPGLYSACVTGYKKTGIFNSKSNKNIEFQIWCTVIIPRIPGEYDNNLIRIENMKLNPGDLKREFVEISPTQTAFSIRTQQEENDYAHIITYVFNPSGKDISPVASLNSNYSDERTTSISSEKLIPGIWEVDFYAPFTNSQNSIFNYEIATSELALNEKSIHNFYIRNGSAPSGFFTAINNSNNIAKMRISGGILGVQRNINISDAYSDYEYSFNVGDLYRSVEFTIELSEEIFNKLTDFTINIKTLNGKILKTSALKYKTKKITFNPPSSGDYILELVPAFALGDVNWNAKLTESFIYFNPVTINHQNEIFYPGVEKQVSFSLSDQINVAPDGFYLFGQLWIDSIEQNFLRITVPVEIDTHLK